MLHYNNIEINFTNILYFYKQMVLRIITKKVTIKLLFIMLLFIITQFFNPYLLNLVNSHLPQFNNRKRFILTHQEN